MVLPGSRQLIDSSNRDIGFKTARDEGAYHPCPALAIPPPFGGSPHFDFPQSRSHRCRRQLLGKIRHSIGVIGGNPPLPQLGRRAVQPGPVARDQDQIMALLRQCLGIPAAQARGGAGDQC